MTAPTNEDDLIARYFAPLAGPGGLALKDDAALIAPPPGCEIVTTVDAIVAGVHFFADDPPASVARKALRVNLSDLAAKGADPIGFLVALALPRQTDAAWIKAFADGLAGDVARYDIALLGGDTVSTPGPAMVSVTAFGSVPNGKMVPRTGAQSGDLLYVSGTIGDAALGLTLRLGQGPAALSDTARAHLLARYLEPQPRNGLCGAMREHARAGMDVSDGFVGDLAKMCRVSGVSARVTLADVPLSPAAREAVALDRRLFETALTGGDDYELLAAVAPAMAPAFETAAHAAGVAIARIGVATQGDAPAVFLGPDGTPVSFTHGSYSHV